jgi:hypothetical protein
MQSHYSTHRMFGTRAGYETPGIRCIPCMTSRPSRILLMLVLISTIDWFRVGWYRCLPSVALPVVPSQVEQTMQPRWLSNQYVTVDRSSRSIFNAIHEFEHHHIKHKTRVFVDLNKACWDWSVPISQRLYICACVCIGCAHALTDVGMNLCSFWRPSRGPTSMIDTCVGIFEELKGTMLDIERARCVNVLPTRQYTVLLLYSTRGTMPRDPSNPSLRRTDCMMMICLKIGR